jgi:nicotinamidase-related amidase
MADTTENDVSLARDLEAPSVSGAHKDHSADSCGIAAITRPEPSKRDKPLVDPRTVSLDRDDAILFIIDVQERLCAAMDPEAVAAMTKNIRTLMKAAQKLGLPIICSEQYPKGLGRTLPAIAELLSEPPLEKLEFSAGSNEPLARKVFETGRRQVILAGMESHVCVFQTARDLVRGGFATFVVEDAVISRAPANRELGFRLCEKAGATRTGTEVVLFDLLVRAGTPEFKELSPLVR